MDAIDHDGIEHAGYLSFLLMLSILPFIFFLALIVALIGSSHFFEYITHLIIDDNNLIIVLKPRIKELLDKPPHNLLTIAVLSAIWTSSSIFEAMRTVLNKANRVDSTPPYIIRRFLSVIEFMIVIIITIFVIFFLTLFPKLVVNFSKYIKSDNIEFLLNLENQTSFFRSFASAMFGSVILAFLYYFLPNTKQRFSDALPGSVLAIALWICCAKLFTYYIDSFHQISTIYGSIASVIIALLFFYFSSFIFILGAEFNFHVRRLRVKNMPPL